MPILFWLNTVMLNQPTTQSAIQTQHILVDGVHMHESHIPAGRKITTKQRPVDRVHVLAQGSVMLNNSGVTTRYDAPAYILLEADRECEISMLTDTTLYGIDPTPAETIEQVINKDVEIEHYFAGVLVGVVDTKESPNNIFIVAQKRRLSTFYKLCRFYFG